MGIKGLSKVIADRAPHAVANRTLANYGGRTVAVDASTWLYQFLIAVRHGANSAVVDSSGESTSHLQGFFYRTIRLLEAGVRPVYVFDGEAPTLKRGELDRRRQNREAAAQAACEAHENMDDVEEAKQARRTVRATSKQCDELKTMLRHMGVPVIDAPGEAEATCAHLCRAGNVYAVATEDMDTLCFGAPIVLRDFGASDTKRRPVREYRLNDVLAGFGFTMAQFVDFAILLGCDYCDGISGIGPKRAFDAITVHTTIEQFVASLQRDGKYAVPADLPLEAVRELFRHPRVLSDVHTLTLRWTKPDTDEVVRFLCTSERSFDEARVRKGCEAMRKAMSGGIQPRVCDMFAACARTPTPSLPTQSMLPCISSASSASKRSNDRDHIDDGDDDGDDDDDRSPKRAKKNKFF